MGELQLFASGIVVSPEAEQQIRSAPPLVAELLRGELVRRAALPVQRSGSERSSSVAGWTLHFTADEASGTLIAERVSRDAELEQGSAPSFRILLVDDDRFALTLLGDRLQRLGHEVVSVDSGEGALKADLEAFDAIVCDFVMPEMNGAQLLRRVREDRHSRVRFIFVTASRHPEELVREAIRHDADFLPKPVRVEELVELIAERVRPGTRVSRRTASPAR